MNDVPEWVPQNADKSLFASSVKKGVGVAKNQTHDDSISTLPRRKRRALSFEEYRDGVLGGNKTVLARAITLVESNSPEHFEMSQKLLAAILPATGGAFRIGITGVPGAGKSSFIEAFGTMLCQKFGRKVAVLAVDPSSSISGGSILGDKTRMENLSRCPNAFIRPSPSGGMLGGVARKSRETMLLCEAAGFDTILVETVGVGQSETTVRSMTDFFLLVQLASQGDELQGIKKGVIELADGILVNKCDGVLVEKSQSKRAELQSVLRFLKSITPGWNPFCEVCSALTGLNIEKVWGLLENYRALLLENGYWQHRRAEQRTEWFKELLESEILRAFYSREGVEGAIARYRELVENSTLTAASAVKKLMESVGR